MAKAFDQMRAKEALFPYERMVQLVKWDPDTGDFHYKHKSGEWREAKPAGSSGGYVTLRVEGYSFAAARVAYLLVMKEWPPELMDHIDGNPSNNRAENLRPITFAGNSINNKENRKRYTADEMVEVIALGGHSNLPKDSPLRRVVIRMPETEAAELEDMAFFSGASVASIARSAIRAGKEQVAYTEEQQARRRRIAQDLLSAPRHEGAVIPLRDAIKVKIAEMQAAQSV